MSKCIHCGSSFTFRKKIQLKDAEICKRCFRELGFDEDHDHFSEAYSYDEIKDGREEMLKRMKKARSLSGLSQEQKDILVSEIIKNSFSVQYGGKEKALECEPEEEEIFNILCSMFEELGRNPEKLDFVRLSDNYVSAKIDEWDLARFHWGPRSKWIQFPTIEASKVKHKIKTPEEVEQFSELLQKSVEHIAKYS